ncbi:hypothetical protein O6H91_14G081300 [Diphasiastrum complanatum]|uniref:Uncharacterized protein n=1 Tax=Diphasiastrum complanatum TaxID=34168 RepID=A0ACC2BRG5_DIPCM|nr:hypothetical protein O6H91_14G081300 [Diphasiastrum complanatum]
MRKSRELKREKIVQEGVFNEEQKTCTLPTSSFSRDHISKFLIEAVSEKTGIPKDQISVDKKLDSYGIDSIGIVWIAHRLSNFLGVHVAALDIYAASHISELIDIVDRLGQEKNMSIISDAETHGEIGHCRTQISSEQAAETPKKPHIFVDSDVKSAAFTTTLAHRVSITALQTISVLFMAFLLTSPAIFPGNGLTWLLSKTQSTYLIVLTKGLVPATFIFYVILVGLTFSLLGMTLQLTKYPLQTWIPFWSKDFVRRWTIGGHSVLMPKSTLEDGASVAALSVAPPNSILSGGDIYVGVEESLVKVRNRSLQKNSILARFPYLEKDVSIAEMDPSYLQAISQVVERFAATSICLRKRALHQTGIGAKGTMKILEGLHGLPNHDIFFPGRTFPVILRHSNAFSVHDDACPDVRGAGLRILESEGKETLLDLVLKTGQAFYVRNLVDHR